ncbi:molybdenum cofactor guanylyltransferase [Sphingomonas sp. ASY06-1R]|uniref:molybdenum cofactor guanylyltransferase n=1 Tax=Sphingomonas sp. ASY06-1R TaxID=3445771 RepID=UPI003FA32032
MKPLGALLAGGRSSRFGSDKALALLAGEPLLAHAARAIQPFVAEIIICGRIAPMHGFRAVADRPGPDLGPLGGVCGALQEAAARGYDRILTIGCDMPIVPSALIERLITAAGAAYVVDAPILGVWPTALGEGLAHHLSYGEDRSIRRWAASVAAVAIDAAGSLVNVNRPEDLVRFEVHRGRGDPA